MGTSFNAGRMVQIVNRFHGPHGIVRFRVDPAVLETVKSKVDAITVGQLREAGFASVPDKFDLVDERLGIIRFGDPQDLEPHFQPITVLENALGLRRLPETLEAYASMTPHEDADAFSISLSLLLSALIASGAAFNHGVKEEDLREAVERNHFAAHPSVIFQSNTVRLTLSTSMRFNYEPTTGAFHLYHTNITGTGIGIFRMRASLVQTEDTLCVEGNDILKEGLMQLIEPFTRDEAPVRLEVVDRMLQGQGWNANFDLKLSVRGDLLPPQ